MSIKEQLWIEEALLRHDKRNWYVPHDVIITPCRDCHPNVTVRVHYQGPWADGLICPCGVHRCLMKEGEPTGARPTVVLGIGGQPQKLVNQELARR